MRPWLRRLIMLSCLPLMLVLPRLVAAQPAECPGGYSDSFQLEGEVNQVKTFTLPDLLLQSHNWTRVKDFFLAGSGSDSGTFTGILLWDLLQEAQIIVDPARRNDLSRKSVLITGSDCYEQLYVLGELEPRLGAVIRSSSHFCATTCSSTTGKAWHASSTRATKREHVECTISPTFVC